MRNTMCHLNLNAQMILNLVASKSPFSHRSRILMDLFLERPPSYHLWCILKVHPFTPASNWHLSRIEEMNFHWHVWLFVQIPFRLRCEWPFLTWVRVLCAHNAFACLCFSKWRNVFPNEEIRSRMTEDDFFPQILRRDEGETSILCATAATTAVHATPHCAPSARRTRMAATSQKQRRITATRTLLWMRTMNIEKKMTKNTEVKDTEVKDTEVKDTEVKDTKVKDTEVKEGEKREEGKIELMREEEDQEEKMNDLTHLTKTLLQVRRFRLSTRTGCRQFVGSSLCWFFPDSLGNKLVSE